MERQFVERIGLDLLFHWFVVLCTGDPLRDATTFTKNRDRQLGGGVTPTFLVTPPAQPKVRLLLSPTRFSFAGTLPGLGQRVDPSAEARRWPAPRIRAACGAEAVAGGAEYRGRALRHLGLARADRQFSSAISAFNLVHLSRLLDVMGGQHGHPSRTSRHHPKTKKKDIFRCQGRGKPVPKASQPALRIAPRWVLEAVVTLAGLSSLVRARHL